MISILSQGNRVAAYVTHYIADHLADVMWLPPHVMPGSTCFVIETSEKYMMNSAGAWIKIEGGNSGNGNNGGNNDSSASNDYNSLENTPVINLTGTAEAPINFQRLGYGNYVIAGNYIYSDTDNELKTAANAFLIEVVDDNITMNKVVKIEDYEDGEYFIETLIYTADGEIVKQKLFPAKVIENIPLVEY